MAWLVGSTDVANFEQDLYDLLRGAISAGQRGAGQPGNGAQVSGEDAWDGVDAVNRVVRSKATHPMWRTPLRMWRGMPRIGFFTGTVSPGVYPEIGKPTFSGRYTGSAPRAYFRVWVFTANTNPGSLDGLVVRYELWNSETNTSIATNVNVSGWTGTKDTRLLRDGVYLTLSLQPGELFDGNASSFRWIRGYAQVHPEGIDYLSEAPCLKADGVLTVAPSADGSSPYALDFDFELVREMDGTPTSNRTATGSTWYGAGVNHGVYWKDGGTAPLVGEDYYLVEAEMYSAHLGFVLDASRQRVHWNAIGGWDPVRGRGKWVSGTHGVFGTLNSTSDQYSQIWNSSNPPLTAYINYWISVKRDKLVIVLRGDPAHSGSRVTVMTLQKYLPIYPWDVWSWVLCADSNSSNGDVALAVTGKWVYEKDRLNHGPWGLALVSDPEGITHRRYGGTNALNCTIWGTGNNSTSVNFNPARLTYPVTIPAVNPSIYDDKWWLYSLHITANRGGRVMDHAADVDSGNSSGLRGKLHGIWYLGSGGWANFDRLVDGEDRYLLVIPSVSFSSAARLAIKEE